MLAAIEQAVQRCDREAFSLPLAMDQQAAQHCRFETLSLKSCQPTLEFSWHHVKDRLPVRQASQFQHALLSTAFGS